MADAVSVVDSAESAIIRVAVEAGEAALIAEFPWLGLPIIKQIWEFFVSRLSEKVILALQKGTNIQIIDFGDAKKNEAAKQAKDQLQGVLNDPTSTAEARADALAAFRAKYADLVRMRVATS